MSFYGKEYLETVDKLNDRKSLNAMALFAEIDSRNPRKRKVTIRDVSTLYGQRHKHDDVWHLSPYEFVMYWEPTLAKYPLTLDDCDSDEYHVRLTLSGKRKLEQQESNLQPGRDYEVKEGGSNWRAFPNTRFRETFSRYLGTRSKEEAEGSHFLRCADP